MSPASNVVASAAMERVTPAQDCNRAWGLAAHKDGKMTVKSFEGSNAPLGSCKLGILISRRGLLANGIIFLASFGPCVLFGVLLFRQVNSA